MKISYWLKKGKSLLYPPSMVLMYHRVADVITDPWSLSVSPSNFEQQLVALRNRGNVVPLDFLLDQMSKKNKLKGCIALTFDDGYADNFLIAKPLLEKYDLPATFFISNHHIGTDKEFWWDELDLILFHSENLPAVLRFNLNGKAYSFSLADEEVLTEDILKKLSKWDYTYSPDTLRAKAYMEIWKLLSPLKYEDQQFVIREIKENIGKNFLSRKSCHSMSESQLITIANHPRFIIGGHTVSHPALASHPNYIQELEVRENKQYLESLTGAKIDTFAYPSGNYNEDTIKILKQLGYKAGFTTQSHTIDRQSNFYELGRFQVNNWSGDKFEKMLSHFRAY